MFEWPTEPSVALYAEAHRVIRGVVSLGGAVGWLTLPSQAVTRQWVDEALVGVGGKVSRPPSAGLCVARVDGVAEALGCWRRRPGAVFAHSAVLNKIMVHPSARGLGLGRALTAALVDACRVAGMETVTLTVRGNNHLAIAIYASLGFEEWGRLPNVIEVGDLRFDDVHMALRLPVAESVRPMGSPSDGPGSSPVPESGSGSAERRTVC